MAKGGGERGALLPVSADDDGKGNGGGGGGDDAVLFKGSAMTRRGAAAALSYMACSGTRYARSAPSLPPVRAAWLLATAAWTARSSGNRVGCFVGCVQGIWGRANTCITCFT